MTTQRIRDWLRTLDFQEILSFAAVGVVSLITDLLVLNTFLWLQPATSVWLLIAYNTVGFGCGWVVGYLGNRFFTFGQGQQVRHGAVWRSGVATVTGMMLNNLLLVLLLPHAGVFTEVIAAASPQLVLAAGAQVGATVTKVAVGCMVGVWNFSLNRFWVY